MVGNRTRIKVVKNKVSPPFKIAEFDILYGEGISREGSIIDLGVETGLIKKSGSWFTYDGDQLGQGKEKAREFLKNNPDLSAELEDRIARELKIGPYAKMKDEQADDATEGQVDEDKPIELSPNFDDDSEE